MMIKKDVFKKVGFFDASFFLYYEDADFCLRAKEKGFLTKVNPAFVMYHSLSASVGKMSKLAIYHLLRSGIYFGKKHAKNSLQKVAHKFFIQVRVAPWRRLHSVLKPSEGILPSLPEFVPSSAHWSASQVILELQRR